MGEVPPARRLWLLLAVALASVVAVAAAYLAPLHERQAAAKPLTPALPVSSGSPAAGVPPGVEPPAGPGAGGGPAADGTSSRDPVVVRYGFEGESHVPLRVHAVAGGAVQSEPRGSGRAVRFPPPCPDYGDPACPRVIIETSFAANPGTAPLRFGATVRLAATETSNGENVLQKGFSHGHSQFKLQIDGSGGQPSCVLVGTSSPQIHAVMSGMSVADGQWHTIECARIGTALTVLVDGTVAGRADVPAALSIVNTDRLRIGGKGTSANNDQFHGALDDVFVSIGCEVPC
jgi:hypothetical protein